MFEFKGMLHTLCSRGLHSSAPCQYPSKCTLKRNQNKVRRYIDPISVINMSLFRVVTPSLFNVALASMEGIMFKYRYICMPM